MSYLDNLESNLKSMEDREERSYRGPDQRARLDAAKAKAAAAPYAEQLRRGPFAAELMNEAVRIGFGLRTKVYISWVDGGLRLDAREFRLELKATPEGVVARFSEGGTFLREQKINLGGNAKKLAEEWMSTVGPRPAAG
ncbi:MAG: hypothetical protein JSU00_28025 [Acidobacteria bacterium]|nr:hypothetical protein [Acidobacteriota bacterium]